ncbi:MAG: hypothetical protein NC416_00140 [Eubacterium sp.]|nr:hypothetical protein [Eubacterium sp.]
MIVLLEPVCSAWIHEEVNAGFLQLIMNNSSDEEVTYIGEKNHLHCIKKIYDNPQVHFIVLSRFIDFHAADLYKNLFEYFRLLCSVMIRCKPDKLFVLCGYRPCILAVELVSILFRNVEINLIVHGMIEEKKGHKKSYDKLFKIGNSCKRLRFVSYSPYCTGRYWNIKEDKFVFLHHPYVKSSQHTPASRKSKESKIIIGIIGACANEKAKKLISLVNKNELINEYEFWVASKFGKKFKNLKNVKVLDLEFERKNIEKIMCSMNYLLLPYGKDEYMLSASGVVWDAVSNRIPCLMLDSKYFAYYMPYKIGYQADSIKELCEIICDRIQEGGGGNDTFFVGMDQIDWENEKKIKYLLQ